MGHVDINSKMVKRQINLSFSCDKERPNPTNLNPPFYSFVSFLIVLTQLKRCSIMK